MKIAVISYHKNIDSIYPKKWIEEYRGSMLNQTCKSFDIFECDYGGDSKRIFNSPYYMSKGFKTFVDCMNFMITHCFESGYDYVFNTNVDDVYPLYRLERQLLFLSKGYDLVSGNFTLIDEDSNVIHTHDNFHKLNLRRELNRNHNIVAHPAVAYSKYFWHQNRYDASQIPYEDLKLWQRSVTQKKMLILKENLLFHRIHNNSVCKSENR